MPWSMMQAEPYASENLQWSSNSGYLSFNSAVHLWVTSLIAAKHPHKKVAAHGSPLPTCKPD
eukprot:4152062-Amphidinium_carterae.1